MALNNKQFFLLFFCAIFFFVILRPWKFPDLRILPFRIPTACWSQRNMPAPKVTPTLFPPSQTRGLWDAFVSHRCSLYFLVKNVSPSEFQWFRNVLNDKIEIEGVISKGSIKWSLSLNWNSLRNILTSISIQLKLYYIKVCCFIAFNIVYIQIFSISISHFLSDPYILLAFLQVKKTTPLWSGSGSMRARPSVALPVVPTTNWCPTIYPMQFLINTALRII